jgi:hypothetical protein
MTLKITIFKPVTPCSLVDITHVSDQRTASIFGVEERSSTLNMEAVYSSDSNLSIHGM